MAAPHSIQTKPVKITTTLVNKIKKIKPDSSNAYEVVQLIGEPAACLPLPDTNEAWICQWKGDLTSASLDNTLNIMFSAGMITKVMGVLPLD
jgi:hypothetical protein